MTNHNLDSSADEPKTKKPRKRKIERTIRIVSILRGFKCDKKKIDPEHFKSLQNRRGIFLITLEKGKVVSLRTFANYHLSKKQFRALLEYYSKNGEVTGQGMDEFTVLTEAEKKDVENQNN